MGLAIAPEFTQEQRSAHEADERIVEAGMAVFVEVGAALMRIRDRKSYLLTHPSFDEYLSDRWGLSYHYAWEVMAASQVVRILKETEEVLPPNARVAFELRPLLDNPKALVASWREIIQEHDRPTAQIVRKAMQGLRSRRRGRPDERQAHPDVLDAHGMLLNALDRATEALANVKPDAALKDADNVQRSAVKERVDSLSSRVESIRAALAG